jgi:hypothetical protein
MVLNGNVSLHVLGYTCHKCWKNLSVTAVFKEDVKWGMDAETRDAIDTTE